MTTILYLLTVVAVTGQHASYLHKDWRYMGTYDSYPDCIAATQQLKLSPERFLCQPTGVEAQKRAALDSKGNQLAPK